LTDDDRVAELAAMIGGPAAGVAATASARDLLERAAAFRASRAAPSRTRR